MITSVQLFSVPALKEYCVDTYSLKDSFFEPYEALVKQGLIRSSHTKELVLYNYTDQCTYERHWNDITIQCRGIVFEKETTKIIARPFPKFFNVGEVEETRLENLPRENYRVFEKEDGSLGVLFNYRDEWVVATRGSFFSDQALKAREMLSRYDLSQVSKDYTLMTEIIYPDNKL